jgi:hypothetical protein
MGFESRHRNETFPGQESVESPAQAMDRDGSAVVPGKRTQLDRERETSSRRGDVRPQAGKETAVMREAQRWAAVDDPLESLGQAEPLTPSREVSGPERRGSGLQWRLDRAFDYDSSGVRIWRDRPPPSDRARAPLKHGDPAPTGPFAFLAEPRPTRLFGSVHRRASGSDDSRAVKRVELETLLEGSVGEPLPGDLRGRLARRLDGDLAALRIHTGGAADAAAHFLQADAFALGRDIYFAHGKYDPTSPVGQRLIAHEVAHTAQHGGNDAGVEIAVSAPGDAHEQAADTFADDFISEEQREREPSQPTHVVAHDDKAAPRLVTPVAFAGISRHGPMPFRPLPTLPSTKSLTQLGVDDVRLFPGDRFDKPWTHVDQTIPIAKGVFAVGGIPVTYNADAAIHVGSFLGASYGPGMIEGIKVNLSGTEAAGRRVLSDDPIVGVRPLGPFGPKVGVGPSPRDLFDKAMLSSPHSAEGTARVSASASAGMSASATASGGVSALDIFGGGVTAGVHGSATASADARANAFASFTYESGRVTVTRLTLGAELEFGWNLSLGAFAGIYVELKMPQIPVISELTHAVQDWPVIGWITPDLTKLRWRKDFTKKWDLIREQGTRKWKKEWHVIADGTSPSAAHPMSLPDNAPYDFHSMIKSALAGNAPKQDIPARDDGPDAELKDGASAGAVASTRQAAKAQVKSARANVKREREWDKQELVKVNAAIKKAAAKAKSAGPARGAAPPLAIGSGGGGGTPEEQRKHALEQREEKLTKADLGAQNVDAKIDAVKGEAENRPEGPARNQAREGFLALGQNADKLGQAVGGYGAGAGEFKRPEDTAAAGTPPPNTQEAEKVRLEARKALDEAGEKFDTELIRIDREWHDATATAELAAYAAKLDGYRADIRIQCSRPLDKLNKEHADVPQAFRDDPDGQIQAYRTIILPEIRELGGKFDALAPSRPEPPWDKKWVVLEDRKLLLIPSHRESRPIRNTMYPDYKVSTKRWLQSRLETRVGPKTGQTEWRYSEATPVSPSTGEPHWWLLDGPDNERPTIAHDQPSVGTHWNGTGRFVTQKERGVFMDGLDKGGAALGDNAKRDKNLGIEPKKVNSEKANKARVPLNPEVGVPFRGPESK